MKINMITFICCFITVGVQARITKYASSYDITAPTEEEVIEKVERILPDLQYMRIKKVISIGRSKYCRFRANYKNDPYTFKITGVDIDKMYRLTKNEQVEPYYRAKIEYFFSKCRSD